MGLCIGCLFSTTVCPAGAMPGRIGIAVANDVTGLTCAGIVMGVIGGGRPSKTTEAGYSYLSH